MSPTPTASDDRPARPSSKGGRKAWAPRWLVVTHRYVGVAVGALMLLWCFSGVVMLFVHYPEVGRDERLARLAPIDWSRCCTFGRSVQDPVQVEIATLEDLAGAPVLRLKLAGGHRTAIDLATGRELHHISAETAVAVARAFGGASGGGAATPIERDQWTVSGEYNRGRPFWRVRLADRNATDVYVSQSSGEVMQRTTAQSRVLNWLGAVPHWLYPTILRQDTRLWNQVVVWTSLTGTFLTLTGLYLGIVAWRPFRDKRLSPYRGLMTWHHLVGLVTGVLTLTWVASGLVSMNPWGFLESPDDPTLSRIAGEPPTFGDVQMALMAVAERHPAAAQVRVAPFAGEVFVLAGGRRYDAQGHLTPLKPADLVQAGASLGPVARQGIMRSEDAYYFTHHEPVALPAWRVIRKDGTRVYLDPASGDILHVADPTAQTYRWLFLGLHRLDFAPAFSRGAGWSAAMVLLLAGVIAGVGTGVWLGWRRIVSDVRGIEARWRATTAVRGKR